MMSSSPALTLQVTLGYGCNAEVEEDLDKACCTQLPPKSLASMASNFFAPGSASSDPKFFVASASHVDLSIDPIQDPRKTATSTTLVAVFVPPTLIEACLEKYTSNAKVAHASGSCFWIKDTPNVHFTQHLLPSIHSAVVNCKIRGIVRTSIAAEQNAPAEIVLLDWKAGGISSLSDLLHATNGKSLHSNSTAILKMLPISNVQFASTAAICKPVSQAVHPRLSIPICPVCIHRIDPVRLGLPTPSNQDLCSKFCPMAVSWAHESCHKQRLLERWPPPSRCTACQVIHHHWTSHHNQYSVDDSYHYDESDLFCGECAMHRTLWVCLTCGYVGCGRYTNKHSVKHFQETSHPFALELATLRIWDYVQGVYGGYAHRPDLLECPSSPPLSHPWITSRPLSAAASSSTSSTAPLASMAAEKSPKKATMIGEEYEALLQSALEDQALHYEGEIARLRAELMATLVDKSTMTPEEQKEIDNLKADIAKQRAEIDLVARELLDTQSKEAGHRATSQQLLAEQQKANELLKTIEEEAHRENERGKFQVEDLEQQIQDLTANLRMRQQFSDNEELKKAQIFGTTTAESKPQKRGKKKGRNYRK